MEVEGRNQLDPELEIQEDRESEGSMQRILRASDWVQRSGGKDDMYAGSLKAGAESVVLTLM